MEKVQFVPPSANWKAFGRWLTRDFGLIAMFDPTCWVFGLDFWPDGGGLFIGPVCLAAGKLIPTPSQQ